MPIVALFDADRVQVAELAAGASGFVVTDRTPFYLEAGGQVSDTGTHRRRGGGARDGRGHGARRARAARARITCASSSGALTAGDVVTLEVDAVRRDAIRRNHTATHLLHAALRQVLGPHVKQAGSLVAPDRLRFDFIQPSPIAPRGAGAIERLVNDEVLAQRHRCRPT